MRGMDCNSIDTIQRVMIDKASGKVALHRSAAFSAWVKITIRSHGRSRVRGGAEIQAFVGVGLVR
jgi:hypothetical protein